MNEGGKDHVNINDVRKTSREKDCVAKFARVVEMMPVRGWPWKTKSANRTANQNP